MVSLRTQNDDITQSQQQLQSCVDSSSTDIEKIQNKMKLLRKQVQDLRLLMTEEQKNDACEDITREISRVEFELHRN